MTTQKRLNARTLKRKPWHELKKSEQDYLWKKQVARCDKAFSLYIRQRDQYCATCGTSQSLQCSHLYTKRAHMAVRWDERNALTQCASCHTRHHTQDPCELHDAIIERIGGEEYAMLKLKAHSRAHYLYQDLVDIEIYYTTKWEAIR